jgi:hypothetical protein
MRPLTRVTAAAPLAVYIAMHLFRASTRSSSVQIWGGQGSIDAQEESKKTQTT